MGEGLLISGHARRCTTRGLLIAAFVTLVVSAWSQEEATRQTRLLLPASAAPNRPTLVWHTGHFDDVTCVAYSHDGKRLASGAMDQTVFLYDLDFGVVEDSLFGHASPVSSLDFSPDDKQLAAGLADGTVVVWDLATRQAVRSYKEHAGPVTVTFSDDGAFLAAGGMPATGSDDVVLWDARTGKLVRTLSSVTAPAISLAFSPDGKMIAALAYGKLDVWGVRVWSTGDGSLLLGRDGKSYGTGRRPTSPARRISFSPDGRCIAALCSDLECGLWDTVDGREWKASRWPSPVRALQFEPGSGQLLVFSDPTLGKISVLRYSTSNGDREQVFVGEAPVHWQMALSPDGKTIATPAGRQVSLWSLRDGKILHTWERAADSVSGVSISPAGDRLAVAREGAPAVVHDLVAGGLSYGPANRNSVEQLDHVRRGSPIRFAPDGRSLVVVGTGEKAESSTVWDTVSQGQDTVSLAGLGRANGALASRGRTIAPVAFSADGQLVAFCAANQAGGLGTDVWLCLHRRGTPSPTALKVADAGFEDELREIALAVSPDGATVRVAIAPERPPIQWVLAEQRRQDELATAQSETWLHQLTLRRLNVFDSLRLRDERRRRDEIAKKQREQTIQSVRGALALTIDTRTGEVIARDLIWPIPLCAGTTPLTISPDLSTLAVAESSGDVSLWDIATQSEKTRLPLAGDLSSALEFSPDGTKLACGSVWGPVTLWDIATRECEGTLRGHMSAITSLSFDAAGSLLASGSRDGSAILWELGDWLGAARARRLDPLRFLASSLLHRPGRAADEIEPHAALAPRPRVTLLSFEAGLERLAATPEGYYSASPGAVKHARWQLGNRAYPLDEWADTYERGGIVVAAMRGERPPPPGETGGPAGRPLLAFISPDPGKTLSRGERNIELVMQVSGPRPVQRVELAYECIPEDRGRLSRSSAPVTRRTVIQLPKDMDDSGRVSANLNVVPPDDGLRIRAVAYDEAGAASLPAELLLPMQGFRDAPPGKLYVLAIGLSRYSHQAWNTIEFADDDAEAFAAAFTGEEKVAQTRVLTNEDATVQNVKFALRQLKDETTQRDTAAVFFAGHGVQRGSNYHFLCHDTDPADLLNTTIPDDDFVDLLKQVRAEKLLLFIDTCHSGGATGAKSTTALAERINRDAGALILAASRGEEVSIERDDWGHGAFTKALLEARAGAGDHAPEDGDVTVSELRDFVAARVQELTEGKQHPESPQWGEDRADMIVFHTLLTARHDDAVDYLAFSADGSRLVSVGRDNRVIVWNLAQSRAEAVRAVPVDRATQAALTPDLRTLLVGGQAYDLVSGADEPVVSTQRFDKVLLSPHGRWLVHTPRFEQVAKVIRTDTMRTAGGPGLGTERAAFSPDETKAIGWSTSSLALLDLESGTRFPFPSRWTGPGQVIALTEVKGIRGQNMLTPKFNSINLAQFAPDSRHVMLGNGASVIVCDTRAWMADTLATMLDVGHRIAATLVGASRPVLPVSLQVGGSVIAGAAMSPDARWVVGVEYTGDAWLWDLMRPTKPVALGRLPGTPAFIPDQKSIVSFSPSGPLQICDIRDLGSPTIRSLEPDDWTSAQLSPDGHLLATGGRSGAVWLWDTSSWEPVMKLGEPVAVAGQRRAD